MQHFFRRSDLRQLLAMLRLLLLFIVACSLVIATGLAVQTAQDASRDLGVPQSTIDSASYPQLPFLGINVALEQYSPTQRQAALATLQQSGFGWVRQRLDWSLLEPFPGGYDWQLSDALLHDIIASGLVPVVVLDGSPAWARAVENIAPTDNPLAPPADPATFARFAAAFATRYRDTLRFYQIWDEPNIAPHWGNRLIEPFAYAQLLKSAAPAIRAADRDALIITAALAPTRDRGHLAIDEMYFLQRLYAAGAAPFFDVVAAQPFGFGATPSDVRARPTSLNFQRVKLLRRAMVAAGDGAKPIWAVRYGWNTHPHSPWRTVRPTDQVAFATDALTLARQHWPWVTAIGWAIDQPAQPRIDSIWGFALTPALRAAFRSWSPDGVSASGVTVSDPPTYPDYGRWAVLLVSWLLLGWRAVAALRILPLTQWRNRYATQSLLRKGVGWLALLILYYFATWPPLIALCWAVAILLISLRPSSGLTLVALVLPFYFQHKELALVHGMVVVPPAHAALCCLGLALLTAKRQARSFNLGAVAQHLHPIDWLALSWIGISLLTSVHVWHWPAYGQGFVDLVLLPCLAYSAVRLLVTTPARQTQLVTALFLGGLVAALIGSVMWAQGEGTMADGVLRLVGPYFSPNHAALYLERALWLGLGLALSMRGALRRWLLLATAAVGVALGLTASRGAWMLGLPMGAVLFAWCAGILQWHKVIAMRRWVAGLAVLGVVVVTGVIVGAGNAPLNLVLHPLWDRFTNSTTVSERVITWQATLQLWQDHWLVGVGPGGFFWHYPSYLPWQAQSDPNLLHPHNLWLELAAGWGTLGLLWFALLLWQGGRMLYALKHQAPAQPQWQQIGLFAALAAGIAHAQVDTFAALPDLAIWQWLVWGLLVNAEQKSSPEQ